MKKIEIGYSMEIESWENDWDAHRIIVINGLTKERSQLYFDIAMLLKDRSFGLANSSWDDDKHESVVRATLMKHKNTLIELWNDDTIDIENEEYIQDYFSEIVYEIVGSSKNYDTYRVVENVKIYDIPFQIEFEEVTELFKNG